MTLHNFGYMAVGKSVIGNAEPHYPVFANASEVMSSDCYGWVEIRRTIIQRFPAKPYTGAAEIEVGVISQHIC